MYQTATAGGASVYAEATSGAVSGRLSTLFRGLDSCCADVCAVFDTATAGAASVYQTATAAILSVASAASSVLTPHNAAPPNAVEVSNVWMVALGAAGFTAFAGAVML